LYPQLEHLQDQLGSLQDCITAESVIRRLKKFSSSYPDEIARLLTSLKRSWKHLRSSNRERREATTHHLHDLIHKAVEQKIGKQFQTLFDNLTPQ
ncbi:MAG: hypothetical protein KDA36_11875, partial [Planctomycetaceae bacterium]|nr:hypothetical protein [Planctomycetaceae bacterium]